MEPKFKHFCPEWDYAQIDERNREFACCNCFPNNPEVDAIQTLMWKEIDEFNDDKAADLIEEVKNMNIGNFD